MKRIEVVAAIIKQGSSVLATQRSYGEWKDKWEFPGGKVEVGEELSQALKREIEEELNVQISVGELIDMVEYDYSQFHLVMHCFLCRIESGKMILKEHEAAKWLSFESLDGVDWLPADRIVISKV